MKISVVSASNRKDGLDIVEKCLRKQTFQDFEWIICSPYITNFISQIPWVHLPEPKKKKGDFYNLNKAWNRLFNEAKGELIVSIVDYTQFSSDTLEILWNNYKENPVRIYSGVGTQYDGNKIVWSDPRIEQDEVYNLSPLDMEFRLASIPKVAIEAVGGIDEEYDRVAAISEKELCLRMGAIGYKFYIDKKIHYKFYKHESHGKEWDVKFKEALALLGYHTNELIAGRRLRLNYVKR